jgi:uncharacterized protein (DUF1800 family)
MEIARMQNRTANKCLLILLALALTFNSLNFTSAARDKKTDAEAAPETWVGDLSPITSAEWNYDRAAHLLERAGFGGTPDEIKTLAAMTPQEAVRHLVYFQNVKEAPLPPFVETGVYPSKTWSRDRMGAAFQAILFGTLDKLPPEQRRVMMADERTGVTAEDKRTALTDKQAVVDKFYYWRNVDLLETARLQTWLADRMLRPLQEKLVLFWHGHFATSDDKVRDYRTMMGQFEMLRAHANGNLRDLLVGVGKDPAMLIDYSRYRLEKDLRELLHLIMSAPEYQLS